jgi:hypothetical protein
MYLQKVISRKNFVKKFFFAGILKVNDANSRIRIQDPDPDPSVRGMDPRIRIRIRIHPKMSWIRNTVFHPDAPFFKCTSFTLRYFDSTGVHDSEMFQKLNA